MATVANETSGLANGYLAQFVYVMEQGCVVLEGPSEEVKNKTCFSLISASRWTSPG